MSEHYQARVEDALQGQSREQRLLGYRSVRVGVCLFVVRVGCQGLTKRCGAWLCKDERCDCFFWLYGEVVSPEWSKEIPSGGCSESLCRQGWSGTSGVVDNVGWASRGAVLTLGVVSAKIIS